MQVKRISLLLGCFLAASTTACGPAASTDEKDYVGEYVFSPGPEVRKGFADLVVLRSDHVALQVRYLKTEGRIETVETTWMLIMNTDGPALSIGQFVHSIEPSGSGLKLGIKNDLAEYYEKIR
jgi:hypothetical protein